MKGIAVLLRRFHSRNLCGPTRTILVDGGLQISTLIQHHSVIVLASVRNLPEGHYYIDAAFRQQK